MPNNDLYGRQPKQYLPFEATTATGAYNDVSTIVASQANFYDPATSASKKISGDIYPYSEMSYESSPLQRVLKTGGVGDGFQLNQHYKTMSYRNGTAAEGIRKWVLSTGNTNATSSASYGDNDLTVSEVQDEGGVHASVYKDKFGRLILKRQDAPASGYYDTYYVYDNIGNIVFIVAPKAIAKMIGIGGTYNTALFPELIYQFWYDGKNRVSRKKVPGAKEVYMVYDPLDRVVLTQDGNMRAFGAKKWSYVKYDNANRIIIQGMYTHTGTESTQTEMQDYVNNTSTNPCYLAASTTYFEIRQAGTSGYSNQCFPTSGTEERQYMYYDDYDFDFDGSADYSKLDQGLTGEATATDYTRGLATGTKKKILGSGIPGTWLTEVSFYDKYYHVIQVRSNNQIKTDVLDHTTNVVNFVGQALEAKQVKTIGNPNDRLNTLEIEVSTRYEYDDMGRLTKVKQTNPNEAELTVAQYEYNALGQLVDKKLGSTNGINYLQSVDMRYNIRGQLISINNSARNINAANNDDANDLFGMEILYEKTENGLNNGLAKYTGMISAVKWSAKTPVNQNPVERSFKYSYDNLYRLTAATYQEKAGVDWTVQQKQGGFNETLTYDENGNIMSLQRNAWFMGNSSPTQIDDLSYSYKSGDKENRLENISDNITSTAPEYGFRNLMGSSSAYDYDDNGNLTSDPKKGTSITYNDLGKPERIIKPGVFGYGDNVIEYRYDASGKRISRYVSNNSSPVSHLKNTEYIGGYVIEDDVLSYYSMAEGRVRNDGNGYGLDLKMEYFITDNQGNTRVSFEDDGTNTNTAVVKQENSYYAFGMQLAGGYTPTNPNKKLYNGGSEWQDDIDGLADYYSTFFREYDPVIGRFNGVDPMSTSFESWTTYHYSYNNPVNFNDPMGDFASSQDDYKQWHDAQYGDNSSRSTLERYMGMYGGSEWLGGGGGGGSYLGSYQQLKDHLDYVGTDAWKMEMFDKEKSKYFWGLMNQWKKQGYAEAGHYWFGEDGKGYFSSFQGGYSEGTSKYFFWTDAYLFIEGYGGNGGFSIKGAMTIEKNKDGKYQMVVSMTTGSQAIPSSIVEGTINFYGEISIYGDGRLLDKQKVDDKYVHGDYVYESGRLPMPVTVFNLPDVAPSVSFMVRFRISYGIDTPSNHGVPNNGHGDQTWLDNYQSIYDKRLAR